MKIHPVVNISQVKPYKKRLEGQPTFKPGPVQVTEDREIEFKVESIIDSRCKGRCLEYLVHWKGYSDKDRTWEPKGNLTNTSEAIKDFHRSKPNTPRALNMSQADFYSLFVTLASLFALFCHYHYLPYPGIELPTSLRH